MQTDSSTTFPFGIEEEFYADEDSELLFPTVENSRNPECNTISGDTLAEYLKSGREAMIIDGRFDYEFQGGHIIGAQNFTDPK